MINEAVKVDGPLIPFVDIWNEEGDPMGSLNKETHGFRILIPVWHLNSCDGHLLVQAFNTCQDIFVQLNLT